MQIKKNEIKNRIIEIAKTEFQDKDFAKASMRKIAKKVEISVSNTYNYFRRKDKIFNEIISPTILLADQLINRYFSNDCFDKNTFHFTIEDSGKKQKYYLFF